MTKLGQLFAGSVLLALLGMPSQADAGRPDVQPGSENPLNPTIAIDGETEVPGAASPIAGGGSTGGGDGSEVWETEWLYSCLSNYPGADESLCQNAYNCDAKGAMQWTLWARQVKDAQGQPTPDAGWQPVLTECRLTTPPDIPTPRPQVTDALVLQEVRRLGLPRLLVRVQPADETLVNFETIFSAESPPWAHTVQLLDYRVDVEAEPTTYVWQFGDGTSVSTQTPGAPYPAKDITHLYSDAGVSVAPRVDTSYAIRYRVDGGPWQSISETVPAAGLPADLRIREATAVLVGD